ncbi:MAG TPA: RidA family protein [Clostridia bacterium]|nr:RidA family protein [Clostridia bacterium]
MKLYPGVPYEYTSSADGLVFAAGACPLDADGQVVGIGDVEAQAVRAVENLFAALAEAGCHSADLLKTTIYVVGKDRSDLVRAWRTVSSRLGRVPSTLVGVSLLGYPDQLIEIEAIATRSRKG